ncbi:MAG: hypothetical protein CL933_20665 [Deltaproteobacteria bacterium]|nr:hypothetical protein [Deltaproteobacteria bacterium]
MAAVKHGGRGKRAWKKLHLGVDRSGVVIAEVLTDGNSDDARTAPGLLGEMDDVAGFPADAAYDTIAIDDTAAERGAKVIVASRISATRSGARDRTVERIRKVGRRPWKRESGYHQQARVENTFFRYKSIIGDRLRTRPPESWEAHRVTLDVVSAGPNGRLEEISSSCLSGQTHDRKPSKGSRRTPSSRRDDHPVARWNESVSARE